MSGVNDRVQRNPAYLVTLSIVTSEGDWYPLDNNDNKTSACGQKVDDISSLHGPGYIVTAQTVDFSILLSICLKR